MFYKLPKNIFYFLLFYFCCFMAKVHTGRYNSRDPTHPSISRNEGRNAVEKEEIRRGKRPMEEEENDKTDRKKKARRESGGASAEPLILELNREEAFEVKEHIFSIVDTFCKYMKDWRENPLKLLKQRKHFDNYKIFMHISGSPKVDEFMEKVKKRLIKEGFKPLAAAGIEINMPDLINLTLYKYKNPSWVIIKKQSRDMEEAKKFFKGNIFKQYMQGNVGKNVSWPQKEKGNLYKIIEHVLEGIMNGKYREYDRQKSFYFIDENKLWKLFDLFPSAQKQNPGHFDSDLYLFWFMLFIGKQIIFNPKIKNPEKGIDLREKYFIDRTIGSVENWAIKKYGNWPTYSSVAKLIQIKIVKKEGDEMETNKGKGKMEIQMESGEDEKEENPFILELNLAEAIEMVKYIENIAEVFWMDWVKKDIWWKNLLELFKQEKHYNNYKKFFRKSWSQKVNEFMEKVKKNRNVIKLAITGYFVSDLYKFWFMLFIGEQIKKSINWKNSYFDIDKPMKSIERWATKKYGSWPTYSSLEELIQIKIVYPTALPQRPNRV